MRLHLQLIFILLICLNCQSQTQNVLPAYSSPAEPEEINLSAGHTIAKRFQPPAGFTRVSAPNNSFGAYLRDLPLKPIGSKVLLYNGKPKGNQSAHDAVIDLPIGTKNLHQCADAIMRLKAEYHWQNGSPEQIHFNFTNGFRVDYKEWMNGKRIRIDGNHTQWKDGQSPSSNYQSFWKYMELIFAYAGTSSLEQELSPVAISDVAIGDVFIQGGFPGHAVIILDMAQSDGGETVFLLGQSYMPAQEFHLLKNPRDHSQSPWYSLENQQSLQTPEWTFENDDLKRFTW